MTRSQQTKHGPLDDGQWPAGAVLVGTWVGGAYQQLDLDHVDPFDPFWISLRVSTFTGPPGVTDLDDVMHEGNQDSPHRHLAVLHGTIDGSAWSATVQSDRVKVGPRRYGHGWARLVSLEVGMLAAPRGPQGQQLRAHMAMQVRWDVEVPDITGTTTRAAYAASRALDRLERTRRWVDAIHDQVPTGITIADLPIDDQVGIVAAAYNQAARQGFNDRRAKVMALGLPEKTAQRRINLARDRGLLTTDRGTR